MSFKTDERVYRFLFGSPAYFVGETTSDAFNLTVAFPSFDKRGQREMALTGPHRISRSILSIKVPAKDPSRPETPTYGWIGEEVSALLGAFYGKHFINLGHVQVGPWLTYTTNLERPCWSWRAAPFNDAARKPTGPELNYARAVDVVASYLEFREDGALVLILRAAEFYRMALENYHERPEMAFTFLISTLECLVDLREYGEDELFDERFRGILNTIETNCPRGKSVAKCIKQRLFQVRRKVAGLVDSLIPEQFFEQREATIGCGIVANRNDLKERILAAYDLRSRLVHTGDRIGFWFLEYDYQGSEIGLGDPVISDNKLKKLLCKSLTLVGLERVVSTVLRTAISEWLPTLKPPLPDGNSAPLETRIINHKNNEPRSK